MTAWTPEKLNVDLDRGELQDICMLLRCQIRSHEDREGMSKENHQCLDRYRALLQKLEKQI